MNALSRRSFLAAAAAGVASPALAQPSASGEIDVIVVGAGAAGIAAARRITAAGRRAVIVEASDQIGGRCITDTKTFGVPFDRGAVRIHNPDLNPLVPLARSGGLTVEPAPRGVRLRIAGRDAREGETEAYLAGMVRAEYAIRDAANEDRDTLAAAALPKTLGEWRPSAEFLLGALGRNRDLDELSAVDFSRSAERDSGAYCRPGYGALLAKLADGLNIRLSAPVSRINSWVRGTVDVETARGSLRGRAIIVTASTAVLTADKIRFDPVLPKRLLEAAGKLTLGHIEHVLLELPGNPLGLGPDAWVVEKAANARTAGLRANVGGSALCQITVGGKHARTLAAQGDAALVAFATDWLASLYGNDVKAAIKRSAATRWGREPWVMGGYSAAALGAQPQRAALAEPFRDRIWLAGEATHETLWGTVEGAWASGERAADAALKKIGPPRRR